MVRSQRRNFYSKILSFNNWLLLTDILEYFYKVKGKWKRLFIKSNISSDCRTWIALYTNVM
jgi:hypothetical protein